MEMVFLLNVVGETPLPHFAFAHLRARTQPKTRVEIASYNTGPLPNAFILDSGKKSTQPRALFSSSTRLVAAAGENLGRNKKKGEVKLKE